MVKVTALVAPGDLARDIIKDIDKASMIVNHIARALTDDDLDKLIMWLRVGRGSRRERDKLRALGELLVKAADSA